MFKFYKLDRKRSSWHQKNNWIEVPMAHKVWILMSSFIFALIVKLWFLKMIFWIHVQSDCSVFACCQFSIIWGNSITTIATAASDDENWSSFPAHFIQSYVRLPPLPTKSKSRTSNFLLSYWRANLGQLYKILTL